MNLPTAIIVDIDGTLAFKGDRDIYDASKCHLDTLNDSLAFILDALRMRDYRQEILLVSGRSEDHRIQTQIWLTDNDVSYHHLWMRPSKDFRPDTEIKREIYEREIADKYNIMAVFDDRLRVARMWLELGLPLYYVGDFTDF